MSGISAIFTKSKETKGTWQYKEDGDKDTHAIGTVYIKKRAFGGALPERVRVTVEAV